MGINCQLGYIHAAAQRSKDGLARDNGRREETDVLSTQNCHYRDLGVEIRNRFSSFSPEIISMINIIIRGESMKTGKSTLTKVSQ